MNYVPEFIVVHSAHVSTEDHSEYELTLMSALLESAERSFVWKSSASVSWSYSKHQPVTSHTNITYYEGENSYVRRLVAVVVRQSSGVVSACCESNKQIVSPRSTQTPQLGALEHPSTKHSDKYQYGRSK